MLLLGAVSFFGAASTVRANTYAEDFHGPALNALWETYLPRTGPTVTLDSAQLQVQVPKSGTFNHWTTTDQAPQVRMDAPAGDFTLETTVSLPGAPKGSYQAGLFVMFGKNDLYLFGPYGATTAVKLERSGTSKTQKTVTGTPLSLRIQKVGTRYTFLYKKPTAASWSVLQSDVATETPVKIGVMLKTWVTQKVEADFSAFSLDAAQFNVNLNQGWLKAMIHAGDKAISGPWLIVKDSSGRQVGGIAKPAQNGAATVFNLPPGTYSVKAVHPQMDSGPEQTVTVSAGQQAQVDLQVIPCPTLKLTRSSSDLKLVGATAGWQMLPGAAGTQADAKMKAYLKPNAPDYTPTGADATLGGTWLHNVNVPGNYGPATIKDNSLFWYRLDMDFPDTYARFANREWTLFGYNIDDEDVSYFNGMRIGSIRSKTTPSSWQAVRSYAIPAGVVQAPGHNIIAIQGYEGGGGAGMTSTGPQLQVPSDSTNNVDISVLDVAGFPANDIHVTATSLGGAYHVDATSVDNKMVSFRWLPEGEYRVAFDRPSGLDPLPPQKMVVAPGTGVQFTFTLPTLPFAYLDGEHLWNANLPGWNFLAIPAASFGTAATDDGPAQSDYVDLFRDPTYNEDWYADAAVPADLGWGDPAHPDKTLPIENNSYFWYRLHLTIPQTWQNAAPDRDLILTQFQVDDSDWTYFNGQLVGQTINNPSKVRTYVIPQTLVKWDSDNVIAIKGHQGTGSAGIMGSNPFAISMKPREDVGAAFSKGDLDGNGVVDLMDAALALQVATGLIQVDPDGFSAADLDSNGTVDIAEVTRILKAAIGVEPL